MKKSKLLLVSMLSLSLIASCGHAEQTPTSQGGNASESSTAHPFNRKIVEDKYLASEATCDSPALYYYSNDLGEAGKETFAYGDALGHQLTKHDAKDASCESEGSIEYYSCSRCKKLFSDAKGKTEISEEDIKIEATGHRYGEAKFDETSSYPNFKLERTCTACGKKETETIEGYDLTKYSFGVSFALDSEAGTIVQGEADEEEGGLGFNIGEAYKNHEKFKLSLPKINYSSFDQVKFGFVVYNIYNKADGDAGYTTLGLSSGDMLTYGGLKHPAMWLTIKTEGESVTATLTGAADGRSQEITLSSTIAKGEESLDVYFGVNDGYRNLVLLSPTIREKYSYSETENHGAKIVNESEESAPTYCTNNYVDGVEKLRFDLTDKISDFTKAWDLYLPKFDFTSFEKIYFPIYLETGAQNEGHLQFSFDGESYFVSDKVSDPSTSYLQFTKNGDSYDVSYIHQGDVLGETVLEDEDVISGKESFKMSGKVDVNWRKFSIGLPQEGEVTLTYDFSANSYGAEILYGDSKTLSPQIGASGMAPVDVNKLRFDLTDTGIENSDYFTIKLPKINYSSFQELYMPLYVETGCASATSDDLQFSFDNENYFHASTADGQENCLHFVQVSNGYEISYLVGGVVSGSFSITSSSVIRGKESFVMYGAASVNWRKFSFLEPSISRPASLPYKVKGNDDSFMLKSGYATFSIEDGETLPVGEYTALDASSVILKRGETTYNLTEEAGRKPLNHDSANKGMWFFEKPGNWNCFEQISGQAVYQDADVLAINGRFKSSENEAVTITLNFTLTFATAGTTIA